MYKSIVIIGPDNQKIFRKISIHKEDPHCLIIGDGIGSISQESFALFKDKVDSCTRIDIVMHGIKPTAKYGNKFLLWSGGSTLLITAASLFNSLSSVNPDVPINIHLWSCYGGLAQEDYKSLPQGSALITHHPSALPGRARLDDFILLKALEDKAILSIYDFLSFFSISYYSESVKSFQPSLDTKAIIADPQKCLELEMALITSDFPSLSDYKITPTLVTHYFIARIMVIACMAAEGALSPEDLVTALKATPNKTGLSLLTTESLEGYSLLHEACALNSRQLVSLLLDNRDDPNKALIDGNLRIFPLAFAISNIPPYEELFHLLINSGANLSVAVNVDGNSFLHDAVICKNIKAIRLLLEAKVAPDILRGDKTTPLMFATQSGDSEIATILIESQADVNVQNSTLVTPLILATSHRNASMVRLLLDSHADAELKAQNGDTAYKLAEKLGCSEITSMLLGEMLPSCITEE